MHIGRGYQAQLQYVLCLTKSCTTESSTPGSLTTATLHWAMSH